MPSHNKKKKDKNFKWIPRPKSVQADTFCVDNEGCLSPTRLPKSGELVAIVPGCPEVDNVLILKGWKVSGTIHLMSNVVIWYKDIEYTYQILMSNDPQYGRFSLVNKRILEQHPGSSARLSEGGGRKSTYD